MHDLYQKLGTGVVEGRFFLGSPGEVEFLRPVLSLVSICRCLRLVPLFAFWRSGFRGVCRFDLEIVSPSSAIGMACDLGRFVRRSGFRSGICH